MRPANLPIRLDVRGGSLQRQIFEGIRQALSGGLIRPGQRIPSSRALASELGVSRNTVESALEQLRSEGYLRSRRGSGWFVVEELPDEEPLRVLHPSAAAKHPPISKRGRELISIRPAAHRLGGAPRPFRPGTPALDLFPVAEWARIAQRRIRTVPSSRLDYSDPAGVLELRQAIAELVRSRGTCCSVDQILVVGGAQRGLDLICHLLLDPGDRVWLEEPGYPGALFAFRNSGARVIPVRVGPEGLDVSSVPVRSRNARLAYVSPSHQFPLGMPMSLRKRRELIAWAHHAGAWIVEDDYDCEFRYQREAIHCLHGLDQDGRVIYLGTFSKTLFPGLRLGFMILPHSLAQAFAGSRAAADVHSSVFDQMTLAEFIGEGHYQRHLRRLRATYRERLDALFAAAAKYCDGELRLRPVQSGLHALADLSAVSAEGVFVEACRLDLEVVPISQYFFRPRPQENALLLGFGSVSPELLHRGMQRLAQAIERARRRSLTASE